MSDIKAGDLVMVVKPRQCCGSSHAIGKVFLVVSVGIETVNCSICGKEEKMVVARVSTGLMGDISRLKKIPPLSDLEDVETHNKDLIPNEKETIGERA